MRYIINDETYHFKSAFDTETGAYVRTRGRTGKGSLPETDDTSVDIALPEECYVGMFMCSHEEDIAETGYLKNVRLIQ